MHSLPETHLHNQDKNLYSATRYDLGGAADDWLNNEEGAFIAWALLVI